MSRLCGGERPEQSRESVYNTFSWLRAVLKKAYAALNNGLIQTIGLTNKEFETFSELQIAAFSVLLHCRK